MEKYCFQCKTWVTGGAVVCPADGTLLMSNPGRARARQQCGTCQASYNYTLTLCPVDGAELSPLPPETSDQLPSFSQKHERTKLIATGTTSRIFAGFEKESGQPVALKLSNISPLEHQYLRKLKRFSRHVEMHSKLQHKNIVKLLDTGFNIEGKFYIAYELVEGNLSLAELSGKLNSLPPEYFIQVFIQVCDALEFACKQGVMHQDLSSGDVLIGEGENDSIEIKIIDFAKGSPLLHSDNQAQQLTEAGDLFGHPEFMSPEVCRGNEVDELALVYSIGCVMYCTMSEKKPFEGNTWAAILLGKLHSEPPSLVLKSVTRQIEALINRCMLIDRSKRFASIGELKSALISLEEPGAQSKCSVLRSQLANITSA